jgi:predicted NBD/HSP70 family sugar kinase
MYLGIDIGGTKTLVASLDEHGVIQEHIKFPTPPDYADFLKQLAGIVAKLSTKNFSACGVGVPGRIDRQRGIGIAMGNLGWKQVPLQADITSLAGCPTIIDNDANLAGLSEAMLLKDTFNRVLYVTISTGIGTGVIVGQKIDPVLADSEGGKMPVEHQGKLVPWESFASGKAIVKRYGKRADQITDSTTWKHIAEDIAIGLIDLIAVVQPQVIVLGGGVGAHFKSFQEPLAAALKRYETPLIPIPTIQQAARPEEAVVYGCYDLAKATYGTAHR